MQSEIKMVAAAILDFIGVPFLCRGWTNSCQIWYSLQTDTKVESLAKIIFLKKNKMAVAAILEFGKWL